MTTPILERGRKNQTEGTTTRPTSASPGNVHFARELEDHVRGRLSPPRADEGRVRPRFLCPHCEPAARFLTFVFELIRILKRKKRTVKINNQQAAAMALGLTQSTVSRQIAAAIEKGWLGRVKKHKPKHAVAVYQVVRPSCKTADSGQGHLRGSQSSVAGTMKMNRKHHAYMTLRPRGRAYMRVKSLAAGLMNPLTQAHGQGVCFTFEEWSVVP